MHFLACNYYLPRPQGFIHAFLYPTQQMNALLALAAPDVEKIRKKTALRTAFAFALTCLLISTATVTIAAPAVTTFVLCFCALGWSIAVLAAQRSDLAIHMCVVSFIALYQLYHFTNHVQMDAPWWVESGVVALVLVLLGFEDCIVYYFVKTAAPEIVADAVTDAMQVDALRANYGYVSGFLLAAGCMVPLPRAGLFYLRHEYQLIILVMWIALAITEARKIAAARAAAKSIVLPHIACKCAPLMYLHPYYWAIVAVFVGFNILIGRGNNLQDKKNECGN